MTSRQIQAAFAGLARMDRYRLIEAAQNRLKARRYPRDSRGWIAFASLCDNVELPRVKLSTVRAAYAIARACLV